MIDIKQLTKLDAGREVVYRPGHIKPEVGTVSSWNNRYVFVRFDGFNSVACSPDDISFSEGIANADRK